MYKNRLFLIICFSLSMTVQAHDELNAAIAAQKLPSVMAEIAKIGEARLDIDERDKDGQTALHVACGLPSTLIVQALVNANADPNLLSAEEFTPSRIALVSRYDEHLLALMTSKKWRLATADSSLDNVVHDAVIWAGPEVFTAILQYDRIEKTADAIAGKDEIITKLRRRIDSYSKRLSKLKRMQQEEKNALLDEEKRKYDMLILRGAKEAILKKRLKTTKDADKILSAQHLNQLRKMRKNNQNNCEDIDQIISEKMDLENDLKTYTDDFIIAVGAQNNDLQTPLILAASRSKSHAVKTLIESNVNRLVQDDKMKNAAHYAAEKDDVDSLRELFADRGKREENRRIIFDLDNSKRTPRGLAARLGKKNAEAFLHSLETEGKVPIDQREVIKRARVSTVE